MKEPPVCDKCGEYQDRCVCAEREPPVAGSATGSLRASVRLKVSDWKDLSNFVNGDLQNMPYDDPVGTQMRAILEKIMVACVKAENAKLTDAASAAASVIGGTD